MAVLVATTVLLNTAGKYQQALVLMPAASNNDTWDASTVTPLKVIDFATCSPHDASTAAADSVSVTWSGTTVTFVVAGTARAQALIVWGRTHPVT
jgi:hypothetical protein